MRKVREALRLKAAGLGNREIAASTGAGKTTVYEILARAEGAGLSWPLPDELDDEALEAMLYPPPSAELAAGRPVPDWREVHRELKRGRPKDPHARVLRHARRRDPLSRITSMITGSDAASCELGTKSWLSQPKW